MNLCFAELFDICELHALSWLQRFHGCRKCVDVSISSHFVESPELGVESVHHEAGGLDGFVGDVGNLSGELEVPSVVQNPLVDELFLDFEGGRR